jgi:16S rRNA (cytosine1402-N4)-methyltransferase
VFAIDSDTSAVARGGELSKRFGGRLTVIHGRFGDMLAIMRRLGVGQVDGIALDIGVSSDQLDDPARGFSFRADGPLDMRMGDEGPTVAEVIDVLAEAELADVIHGLGEERRARQVAHAIVTERAVSPIRTTGRLAEIVRSVVRPSRDGIDPATRTFMAFRIYVNDELGELDRGLDGAEALLNEGGRLAVVAFHSLEDRRVKEFFRLRSGAAANPSRHAPERTGAPLPTFRHVSRRPIRSGQSELAANPRARSALLRIGERTGAPTWSEQMAA